MPYIIIPYYNNVVYKRKNNNKCIKIEIHFKDIRYSYSTHIQSIVFNRHIINFQFDICVMYSFVCPFPRQQPCRIVNSNNNILISYIWGVEPLLLHHNVVLCMCNLTYGDVALVFHLSVLFSDEWEGWQTHMWDERDESFVKFYTFSYFFIAFPLKIIWFSFVRGGCCQYAIRWSKWDKCMAWVCIHERVDYILFSGVVMKYLTLTIYTINRNCVWLFLLFRDIFRNYICACVCVAKRALSFQRHAVLITNNN